ncbi:MULTISPECIES: 6-phospho-beta-glucosidase [unclassified Paenibacillus]|uniref:6-phospho-beta-glucosidase n=1 Tax=unclassified Paenibacillus TaxID=185978 RepID=UPI000954A91D|nr:MULTISPECIES: 6-phospho-beta-glucosidase [unclassified Paenibacillus]SIR60475.1 6-phospho-beta-glucosidase [Paenibacillus sp. RU4X]SIR69304.1 6-phospho-beta-glucosidase [Paenibacillus sp. RU4T]
MKIAIIGAGSTYTPELIEGIIKRKDGLPLSELALMDIDERKLGIVGGLSGRMIEAAGMDCRVALTQDLDEALRGADFVLGQIRVGKLPARVLDERIPLKHGMIGQETCGIGGFFKAMRTIPVLLDIARRMEQLCPDAWLINFSNPAGILTEAILTHTKVKMLGLCNVPYNMFKSIRASMELPDASLTYVGLNHLSWITAIEHDGKDYLQEALDVGLNSETMKNIPSSGFSKELVQLVGAIPSSYLEYYYFKNKKLKLLMESQQSRGERCMEIEEDLLGMYADAKLHTKPELLASRGGANYSEVAISLVDAIWNDKQEIHVVNLLNNGALGFMEDGDAVEISAVIGKDGAKPVALPELDNAHIRDYMVMIKAYERETVAAAVSGSEEAAMRALMMNPLVGDYNAARACFDELKEAHREYLPQFA